MEAASEKEKAEKVCKRCNQMYSPSSNDSSSCRFHPSFFVCRRHDDQKRFDHCKAWCSGDCYAVLVLDHESRNAGGGDGRVSGGTGIGTRKGYYELGPDDPPYAAKFYDCCGAEDPEASGCTTSFHVSYDDD